MRAWRARDPVGRFQRWLLGRGWWSEAREVELRQACRKEVRRAWCRHRYMCITHVILHKRVHVPHVIDVRLLVHLAVAELWVSVCLLGGVIGV